MNELKCVIKVPFLLNFWVLKLAKNFVGTKYKNLEFEVHVKSIVNKLSNKLTRNKYKMICKKCGISNW